MKIATIVGARPQFIKASVVSRAIRKIGGTHESIIHTGQHFDANMSNIFFDELMIPRPEHNLGIGGGTHGQNTGRMIEAIEAVLFSERPDLVLVYGDTDSTLAGTLAAVKLHIPVAHVESGVRSYNRLMPEEINRVLTDHAADLLFTPTDAALSNLQQEGIDQARIYPVGDVMYDASLLYSEKAECTSTILNRFSLRKKNYVLATVHRAENTDNPDRLAKIMRALILTAQVKPVILPLHPRTRAALIGTGIMEKLAVSVSLCEPLGYLDMVMLEQYAAVIATDSGGIQKEAFFYKVPCVTLNDSTEWVELLSLGWNRLCQPKSETDIAKTILDSLGTVGCIAEPYGSGDAAVKIARILQNKYGFPTTLSTESNTSYHLPKAE